MTGRTGAFTLMARSSPASIPAHEPVVPALWRQYVGCYGPAFIPLVISMRHGHLYALIENEFDYRLIPVSRNVFVCPPGMYAEEQLVFLTAADEKVQGVTLANMHCRGVDAGRRNGSPLRFR